MSVQNRRPLSEKFKPTQQPQKNQTSSPRGPAIDVAREDLLQAVPFGARAAQIGLQPGFERPIGSGHLPCQRLFPLPGGVKFSGD
jgi:hypothetical protein